MASSRTVAVTLLLIALVGQTAGNTLPYLANDLFADPAQPGAHATPWMLATRSSGAWFDPAFDGEARVDYVRGGSIALGLAAALSALALGLAVGRRPDWALGLVVPAALLLLGGAGLVDWSLPAAAGLPAASRSTGFLALAVGLVAALGAAAALATAIGQRDSGAADAPTPRAGDGDKAG